MATKLSIYNLAFGHLSEPVVASLTEDPVDPNVAKANLQWQQTLESALSRAAWLCALESPTLPLDTPPPEGWGDWRYPHRFTCPLGTLKVWNVVGFADDAWQKGVAVAPSGAATVVIKAAWPGPLQVDVVRLRPPEALTPLLADALGLLLASRLAGPIQQNEQKADRLLKAAEQAFLLAETAEATEISGQEPMIGTGPLAAARASAG